MVGHNDQLLIALIVMIAMIMLFIQQFGRTCALCKWRINSKYVVLKSTLVGLECARVPGHLHRAGAHFRHDLLTTNLLFTKSNVNLR